MSLAAFVLACRHCWHVTHGRRFCTSCGAKLTEPETA